MAADDIPDVDLDIDVGDVLYQTTDELFVVVTDIESESYKLAVFGNREISAHRLEQYLDGDDPQFLRESRVRELVQEYGSPELERKLRKIQRVSDAHTDSDS